MAQYVGGLAAQTMDKDLTRAFEYQPQCPSGFRENVMATGGNSEKIECE